MCHPFRVHVMGNSIQEITEFRNIILQILEIFFMKNQAAISELRVLLEKILFFDITCYVR